MGPGNGTRFGRIRLNRAEYQRLRRQLDEELRASIDMLQAGYRAKVEALDALWGEPLSEEVPANEPEVSVPPTPEPAVIGHADAPT
jgi:hypothetical protein